MKRCAIYITSSLCLLTMFASLLLASEAVVKDVQSEPVVQQVPVVQGDVDKNAAAISMDDLVERLKNTQAIGFFTKLAIRSDVIGFQDKVKKMREKHKLKAEMANIKATFDGLLLKIMALLEKDPDLSKEIYLARHSIFKSLLEVQG